MDYSELHFIQRTGAQTYGDGLKMTHDNLILRLRESRYADSLKAADRIESLQNRIHALESALDWAYTGAGLDDVSLKAQSILNPFSKETQPDHMVQVALRVVIDTIRERADTVEEKYL